MKSKAVLLVGVGGQGALTTARILVNGLIKAGYDVKTSEIHGMSQRGGSVSTQVIYGDRVDSPVAGLGEADVMIAFEKMEAVRYAAYLKKEGMAIINDYAVDSSTIAAGLESYPEGCIEAMQKNFKCHVVRAAEAAEALGNAKSMNTYLLGSAVKQMGLSDIDWETVISESVKEKLREINIKAFKAGMEV